MREERASARIEIHFHGSYSQACARNWYLIAALSVLTLEIFTAAICVIAGAKQ